MFEKVIILLLWIFLTLHSAVLATHDPDIKAAFIRDQQLWLKDGAEEKRLTTNKNVSDPKWSSDGRFISYLDSNENGEGSQLWVYDTKGYTEYKPYDWIETRNVKWSPVNNQLAYTSGGVLNVTKLRDGKPIGFENVVLGVSDFEWFPDGKNFIVSSTADLLPTGWGPIPLFKVPMDANLDGKKVKEFYTINTDKIFGIDSCYFKWSKDGRWLSFLIVPTASASADSNTLAVLSQEGKHFQSIGHMLNYQNWFHWAPNKNKLAYISGEGRFFVTDKKTRIADIPMIKHQKEFTPKGFVDLGLDWYSEDQVVVARAPENKEWQEGPVPTMLTSLYVMNIFTGEQVQITFPKVNTYDREPQTVYPYITWVREGPSRDAWIKEGVSGQEVLWIQNIEEAPVLFEKIER